MPTWLTKLFGDKKEKQKKEDIEYQYLLSLTAEEIKKNNPTLYNEIRQDFYRSFHIEDLEVTQEVSPLAQILPFVQIAFSVIIMLQIFLKK